jgi:predicted dehydrogenase
VSRPRLNRPIRVGVFGIGRGKSFATQAANMDGVELVALCDQRRQALQDFAASCPGVTTYTDYDEFLHHEMDAVVLANYATEHAPAAVKALERGLHVQSENIACKTMGEAVALARAVQTSGCIYMYAENYCYNVSMQEMRHLYRRGVIGELRLADGEYVHPMSPDQKMWYSPEWDHWRNWLPATYYCTHSMGPLMYITRTRPVKVSGFLVPYDDRDPTCAQTAKRSDLAGMVVCQMDNGAVVRLLMGHLKCHMLWFRIFGHRGSMETLRHGDTSMVRVHKEPWELKPGEPPEVCYKPVFRKHHAEASRAGHGGGDYFTLLEFVDAIRKGKSPYLDVYRGLQMSTVGILAYRSALAGGQMLDVPSFRKASELSAWENDNWSPDPADAGPEQPLPSVLGAVEKAPEVRAQFEQRVSELRKDWG